MGVLVVRVCAVVVVRSIGVRSIAAAERRLPAGRYAAFQAAAGRMPA
jgi:hypothetical protein